jgi:tetratricopeptide (TPR) repeat protein
MINQYRYHAGQLRQAFFSLKLSGSDVFQFLQNQSTFNLTLLSEKCFHLVSFLDPQGRVEFYGQLLHQGSYYQLLIPSRLREVALERLNRFLISEDVEFSDEGIEEWQLLVGPESEKFAADESFAGEVFYEKAYIQKPVKVNIPVLSQEEVLLWEGLSGWPSLSGENFEKKILNNTRLYDLSLSAKKGCYPGQETVSKIATHRGAAFNSVLLEINHPVMSGTLKIFDKKIGEAYQVYLWQDKYYLAADLLRDFRVENLKLTFELNDEEIQGVVKYYPLLPSSQEAKALELFHEALDLFKVDKLSEAEEKFRLAIKIDPSYADAYESLGVMLGRQERFQEAVELMQKLSEIDPKSVLAHTNLSLYLMRLGRIEEAEEQKSLATVKSFQRFGDEAKTKEQENLVKKQQEAEWASRENMFLQVLEIDEEDTLANYGIGSIAVEKGNWDKAKVHLEKVLASDGNYSVAYLALGKAYKGLGLKSEAQRIWKEGILVAAKKGDLMPANQMQSELEKLLF